MLAERTPTQLWIESHQQHDVAFALADHTGTEQVGRPTQGSPTLLDKVDQRAAGGEILEVSVSMLLRGVPFHLSAKWRAAIEAVSPKSFHPSKAVVNTGDRSVGG